MRLAWFVFVAVGALVVAVGVITLLNLAPDLAPLPDRSFATVDGAPYSLAALRGRAWVAAFIATDDPQARRSAWARLRTLADELPERAGLVVFASGEPEGGPDGPRLRRVLGTPESVVALAGEAFGLEISQPVLVACVDRASRVRSRHALGPGSDAAAWETIVGDVRFLMAMDSRPLLHAALNGSSAVLLSLGFLCIRQKRVRAHLVCMVLAALVTLAFLGSYLYYHSHVGSMPFRGEGWVRPVYFAVLISHTVLAAFVAPLAGTLFYLAARRDFGRHKRIARWTLPLWLYVSVTGVLIYFMLYVWFAGV